MEILDWDDFFSSVASLSAMRSRDPVKKTGACIVNDENRLVGIGYNGMPRGIDETLLPMDENDPISSKRFYVCHATMNAVLNKNQQSLRNCRIYCTHIPCNECAKILCQVGIKCIYFLNESPEDCMSTLGTRKLCEAAGISLKQLSTCKPEIYLPL